ncbi:MAG: PDZ domain-containing protein [Vicinamibacterales bacterium]
MTSPGRWLVIAAMVLWPCSPVWAQETPVAYVVTFPAPEHHWLQVDVTFAGLGLTPLRARMSRSSPGRYAMHEFAKNVFVVDAFDSAAHPLAISRPDVDEWQVTGHDGTVRLVYRIFGDFADGTYMAVDTTHAHLNMPATFMWAVGLERRAIEITFVPPAGSEWTAATQLYPASTALHFSAPNLQYFMDSPVELARLVTSTFDESDGAGGSRRFRLMVHGGGGQAEVDHLAVVVARLIREERAVFGALAPYEPGTYTFILDLVPWAQEDSMEHRNSTYISIPGLALSTADGRAQVLDAVAHEFFHHWNVERIRPAGLEPFDFTRQNITCCLWLAEGFTQYYGPLLLRRAGLTTAVPLGMVGAVINGSGRLVRSPVQMSEHGPFDDAAVANDVDDRSRTFISYYTYGAAVAMALDLSLREMSAGRLTLDDYMRRLWQQFGQVSAAPGYVARPYTLADLRRALSDLTGNSAFANSFFDRYVEGRDVADYAHLLGLAGYTLRHGAPTRGWPGNVLVSPEARGLRIGTGPNGGPGTLVPFGTPAYDAGLDSGDLILTIDGQPATQQAWAAVAQRAPGDRLQLQVERRDGARTAVTLTLAANPGLQLAPNEALGLAVSETQRAFRAAWLGSQAR